LTQPAQDPIGVSDPNIDADTASAIARLAEQMVAVRASIEALDRLVTLQIAAQADKVGLALTAADKAVLKAETANEKRFDSVNEFRMTLSDQSKTFVDRREHAAEMAAVDERVRRTDEALKTMLVWQGNITGRFAVLGAVFAVVMTLVVFAANYATRS
jgi:hypothetical protein